MEIKEFFEANNRAAIAFSGGVDSVYLLHAAAEAGADVKAYYVKSAFQPGFEFDDAKKLAGLIGCELRVIEADVLSDERITSNPADRCYWCKRNIMGAITRAAADDGFALVIDGTNASDPADDRPGMRALKEFGIRSPLRECGITKAEVRERSREAGLPVWNKPAYACLATRIQTGEEITEEDLARTEKAEAELFDMGFSDFRVRLRDGNALLQVTSGQHDMALERKEEIDRLIGDMYGSVIIDEETR
jgi:uncharacterized protein